MLDEPQDIETLRRRYEELNTKRTRAEALLSNAKHELDRLNAEAKTKYGTDDLDALQAKLQEMEQENLKRRREYQKLLDKIEEELQKAEDSAAE